MANSDQLSFFFYEDIFQYHSISVCAVHQNFTLAVSLYQLVETLLQVLASRLDPLPLSLPPGLLPLLPSLSRSRGGGEGLHLTTTTTTTATTPTTTLKHKCFSCNHNKSISVGVTTKVVVYLYHYNYNQLNYSYDKVEG